MKLTSAILILFFSCALTDSHAANSSAKAGKTILSIFDRKLGKDRITPAQFLKFYKHCGYPSKCVKEYRQGGNTIRIKAVGLYRDAIRLHKFTYGKNGITQVETAEFGFNPARPKLHNGGVGDYTWKPTRDAITAPDIRLKTFGSYRGARHSPFADKHGCYSLRGFLSSLRSNVSSNRAHRTAARMITRLLKK